MPSGEKQSRLVILSRLIDRAAASERAAGWAALVAGVLSIANAAATILWLNTHSSRVFSIRAFVLSWMIVFVVAGLFLILRVPGRSGVSEWRAALPYLLPATAAAAGATILFYWNGAAFSMAVAWINFYGLGLLGTRAFAPTSVLKLGSLFLVTGVSLMLFVHLRFILLIGYSRSDVHTALIMGATFGIYHLAFAATVLLKRPRH